MIYIWIYCTDPQYSTQKRIDAEANNGHIGMQSVYSIKSNWAFPILLFNFHRILYCTGRCHSQQFEHCTSSIMRMIARSSVFTNGRARSHLHRIRVCGIVMAGHVALLRELEVIGNISGGQCGLYLSSGHAFPKRVVPDSVQRRCNRLRASKSHSCADWKAFFAVDRVIFDFKPHTPRKNRT